MREGIRALLACLFLAVRMKTALRTAACLHVPQIEFRPLLLQTVCQGDCWAPVLTIEGFMLGIVQ
jgi:hypothetical protein